MYYIKFQRFTIARYICFKTLLLVLILCTRYVDIVLSDWVYKVKSYITYFYIILYYNNIKDEVKELLRSPNIEVIGLENISKCHFHKCFDIITF